MAWKDYFPFESGDQLIIEARLFFFSVEGTGEVNELSDDVIDFTFNIPKQSGLIPTPALEGSAHIQYVQEGVGNTGIVTLNGDSVEDTNINISSKPRRKRCRIDPSKDVNGEDFAFTLRKTGRGRAEISEITGVDVPAGLRLVVWQA